MSNYTPLLRDIKKTIDSANINFLMGAGLSKPFLDTLNDIELFLSDTSKTSEEILSKKKEYFNKVMLGNIKVLDDVLEVDKDYVMSNYTNFYKILNNLVLKRENSILTKQVNIFTTNIDIFSEKALEGTGIEFNDGFNGRFNPTFNLGNFKKSYFMKSLHYENTSEIPVFNILKIHGSLTWKFDEIGNEAVISLDKNLQNVRDVADKIDGDEFDKYYKKLVIVNPTKAKYETTLLQQYYYDLLRIYSNELEKENSVLFVIGSSLADEHIRDMTTRVAASNPTLKIYIFAHGSKSVIFEKMENEAKNKNIKIVVPEDGRKYNFETLNKDIFGPIIGQNDLVEEVV